MPFIEILPLSYYIETGNFEALDILNQSNIVVKMIEPDRFLNYDDTYDMSINTDDINELFEMFFEE